MWDMRWDTSEKMQSISDAALEAAEKEGMEEGALLQLRAKAGKRGNGRYLTCSCKALTWYTGGSGIYCVKCGNLL